MVKFLTQKRLEELILKLFPQCHLIGERVVPGSGVRFRPDFRCEEYKVIIEFDGFRHYNNAEVQNRDIIKDYSYEKIGYKIIRIPYFVQASRDLVILILNSLEISIPKNLDEILHEYEYPQGFIDDKAMLPIDFNEFGIELFKADLRKFWFLADEILKSLENKISSLVSIKKC